MTSGVQPPYNQWGDPRPPASAAPPGAYPGPQQPALGQHAAVLPYASPVTAYAADPNLQWAWQEGPLLVVRKGAWLPHHCVKCGAPAEGPPVKRTLYWHEPWVYLLILPGLLIYAIVAICLRKSGTVHLALCPAHRARRAWMLAAAWLLGLGGPALMIFAAYSAPTGGRGSSSDPTLLLLLLGLILLVAGLVVGALSPPVRPKRIDDYFMWLNGAGPAFLAHLPGVVRQ